MTLIQMTFISLLGFLESIKNDDYELIPIISFLILTRKTFYFSNFLYCQLRAMRMIQVKIKFILISRYVLIKVQINRGYAGWDIQWKKDTIASREKKQNFFESNEGNGNQTDWNFPLQKIPVGVSSVVKFHA